MFKQAYRNGRNQLWAAMAILPLLAACGGGDDEGGKKTRNESDDGLGLAGALLCGAVVLVSGDDGCVSSGSSGSSGGGGSSGGSSTGSGSSTGNTGMAINYAISNEFEPNNDALNANVLRVPQTSSPDGFIANGAVNDTSDSSDYYSLSRPVARYFHIALCADGNAHCDWTGEIDTLTAYIDVLDSDGNVIASSQAAVDNHVEPYMHAGLSYTIRVVAGDTMGSTIAYHMTAHEFQRN